MQWQRFSRRRAAYRVARRFGTWYRHINPLSGKITTDQIMDVLWSADMSRLLVRSELPMESLFAEHAPAQPMPVASTRLSIRWRTLCLASSARWRMARTVKQWKSEVESIMRAEGVRNVKWRTTGSRHLLATGELDGMEVRLTCSLSPSDFRAGHKVRAQLRRVIRECSITATKSGGAPAEASAPNGESGNS